MTGTLNDMDVAQLRDLAQRAEATAKQKEQEAAKGAEKFCVTAPVPCSLGMVCLAKDGTVWYSAFGGAWISVKLDNQIGLEFAKQYCYNLRFYRQYTSNEDMNLNHRIKLGGKTA